jgi:glutathione reductase (NADPH)
VDVVSGRASLVDPHIVESSGSHYSAEHIVIASGSAPSLPSVQGGEHAHSSAVPPIVVRQ